MRHWHSIATAVSACLMASTIVAQTPAPPSAPLSQVSAPNPGPEPVLISLDEAITLALAHSHTLKAAQTTIQQSQAQEITASLRPNPALGWDALFFPLNPSDWTASNLEQNQQFDLGVSYLFERGGKRHRRIDAAREATAVTKATVNDTERTLIFNVARQFISAQLANSNLSFAQQGLNSFQQTVNISAERYRAGDISEGDFLKIKLQLLQFQTDVASAQIAKV